MKFSMASEDIDILLDLYFANTKIEVTPFLLACLILSNSFRVQELFMEADTKTKYYEPSDFIAALWEYSDEYRASKQKYDKTIIKFDSVLSELLKKQDDIYVVDTCLKMGLTKQDKKLNKYIGKFVDEYLEFRKGTIVNQRAEQERQVIANEKQQETIMNTNLTDFDLNELLQQYFIGRQTWITPFMVSCVLIAHSGEVRSFLETIYGKATASEIVSTMQKALAEYKRKQAYSNAYSSLIQDATAELLGKGGKDSLKLRRCMSYCKTANETNLSAEVIDSCKFVFDKYDLTLEHLFPEETQRQQQNFKFSKTHHDSRESKTKTEFGIGIDLVERAAALETSPVFGRDAELRLMAQALLKQNKNNVLLVGKAGTGKTALVEGLAYAIATDNVHPMLRNASILSINLSDLVAGTTYRGDLETRLKKILTHCESNGTILFLDEIHSLINGRAKEEQFADLLKPYITGGRLRIIGATTDDEYKTMRDKAFVRRFNLINVSEPTPDITLSILQKLAPKYQKLFGIGINDNCLRDIVNKSETFIHNRNFPDKAIDLLNAVCVLATYDKTNSECTSELVNQSLHENFDIPMEMLTTNEHARIANLNKNLNDKIFGQETAIKQVSDALVCSYLMRKNRNLRPQSVMLFAGPSGVGKTETAKTLAKLLGRELISLNMNEYQSSMDVQKLGGSAPGYIGYDDGGQLTNLVAKNPYAILLFDEFEKAHRDVQRSLLQVFDQGTYTNNFGDAVSFKNTIIILATNAGVKLRAGLGYSNKQDQLTVDIEDLHKVFLPEFLGRMNKIITFNPLSTDALHNIVNRLVAELSSTMRSEYNVNIVMKDEVKNWLITNGYDPRVGARIMQNKFSETIEQPLSYYLLQNYELLKPISTQSAQCMQKPTDIILQLQNDKILCVSK